MATERAESNTRMAAISLRAIWYQLRQCFGSAVHEGSDGKQEERDRNRQEEHHLYTVCADMAKPCARRREVQHGSYHMQVTHPSAVVILTEHLKYKRWV